MHENLVRTLPPFFMLVALPPNPSELEPCHPHDIFSTMSMLAHADSIMQGQDHTVKRPCLHPAEALLAFF